jgi:hypothetical protein
VLLERLEDAVNDRADFARDAVLSGHGLPSAAVMPGRLCSAAAAEKRPRRFPRV